MRDTYKVLSIKAIANKIGKHPTNIRNILNAGLTEIDGWKFTRLGNQWVGTQEKKPLDYIHEDYKKKRG